MGKFKEQVIDVMNENTEQLAEMLILSFPKLRYTIEQARDYNELDKIINLVFSLETDLEPV